MKNKLVYIIGGTIVATSLMLGGNALAAGRTALTNPAIFGTVESVNGSSITVSGRRGKEGTPAIYTVDTSDAQITAGYGQGAVPLSTEKLAVGDKVAVLSI